MRPGTLISCGVLGTCGAVSAAVWCGAASAPGWVGLLAAALVWFSAAALYADITTAHDRIESLEKHLDLYADRLQQHAGRLRRLEEEAGRPAATTE